MRIQRMQLVDNFFFPLGLFHSVLYVSVHPIRPLQNRNVSLEIGLVPLRMEMDQGCWILAAGAEGGLCDK